MLSIEAMLCKQPPRKDEEPSGIGITDEALVAWERMGALKLDKLSEETLLTFDDSRTEYREWVDEQDCQCSGQVNKVTSKPEGIVRKVTR